MDKELLKKQMCDAIDEQQAIQFLEGMIRIPSEKSKPTYAQELVKVKLLELGFDLDSFPCDVDGIKDLDDFCNHPENLIYSEDICNIAATRGGEKVENALLLFSHIDTPECSPMLPDYSAWHDDEKIYGLGVADAKGGLAIILMATQAVLNMAPELKENLLILSTIGKRGAVGTLTAIERGYRAKAGIYVHPAETGHGFQEIKNYSMGAMNFNVVIRGKEGSYVNEIDDSEVSAVVKGAQVITAIEQWNLDRRENLRFKEGTYKDYPNTKVSFLSACSEDARREDVVYFKIKCKMCFGLEERVPTVMEELKSYLKAYFKDDEWLQEHPLEVEYGESKATPAFVARDSHLIKVVEDNVRNISQNDEFIYQYHASSDIRIPMVYGDIPTVGIGPIGGGFDATKAQEWLDIQDYLRGIKMVVGMIVDYCL